MHLINTAHFLNFIGPFPTLVRPYKTKGVATGAAFIFQINRMGPQPMEQINKGLFFNIPKKVRKCNAYLDTSFRRDIKHLAVQRLADLLAISYRIGTLNKGEGRVNIFYYIPLFFLSKFLFLFSLPVA